MSIDATLLAGPARFVQAVRTSAGLPICATPEQLAKEPIAWRMPECEAERAKVAASKS